MYRLKGNAVCKKKIIYFIQSRVEKLINFTLFFTNASHLMLSRQILVLAFISFQQLFP